MRILVTGAAGFIGAALCARLIERGDTVTGIDNLNDYYDVGLKQARLALLHRPNFTFEELDISDRSGIERLFEEGGFECVVHLAAQAGVRYSIDKPHAYADTNLVGFLNMLEGCRHAQVRHLVYASSSSVYGANTQLPFRTTESVDHPISLYAASKKSNELMAHCYSHLYSIRTTGLRFFTVYGPWGRPDMALFKFTRQILAGEPIDVYNHGRHRRDFTYIDDIVEGVVRVVDDSLKNSPAKSAVGSDSLYRLYNIGSGSPIDLGCYIELLESELGKTATKNLVPRQPGDVLDTYADVSDLSADFGYRPQTSVKVGVSRFVAWYKSYYGIA